jgi:hypothetical protein
MAVDQLLKILPWHNSQHGIMGFGIANVALAIFVTTVLGVLVDYAWMLRLRSKMVGRPIKSLFTAPHYVIASRAVALANSRQHIPASRQQALDLL